MKVKDLIKTLLSADLDEDVFIEVDINDDPIDIDVADIDDLGHCVIISAEPLEIRKVR